MFALAVAGLLVTAVSGASQAAPIAPLSAAVANNGNAAVTQVHWHCWIGRWGHRHCHW
jgi:hypothetical protein